MKSCFWPKTDRGVEAKHKLLFVTQAFVTSIVTLKYFKELI